MTKKIERIPADNLRELPLDELEAVLGGAAAPMGMGQTSAATSAQTPGAPGYHDHFGLHFGFGAGSHDAHQAFGIAGAGGVDAHAPSAPGAPGAQGAVDTSHDTSHGASPGPSGMGGSFQSDGNHDASGNHEFIGAHAATTAAEHASSDVNATSAFQLLDQASPQDDAAAAAADHSPAPVGLGGDF